MRSGAKPRDFIGQLSRMRWEDEQPPAEPTRSQRWLEASRRKIVDRFPGGVRGLVALALLAGGSLWLVTKSATPEEVVTDYLDAIRRRRVGEAFRIAGVSPPARSERTAFLRAGAINDRWRVGPVKAEFETTEDGRQLATVTMALSFTMPDGQTGQLTDRGSFALTKRAGEWRIDNPLVELDVTDSPLWYVELNDLRAARTGRANVSGDDQGTYLVFPGIYTLYKTPSAFAAIKSKTVALLPGERQWRVEVETTASETSDQRFQESFDRFLDECLIDQTAKQATPGGCVLYPSFGEFNTKTDIIFFSRIKDARWTLVRRPVVDLLHSFASTENSHLVFAGRVAVPGELRLVATAVDRSGGPETSFAQTCLVTEAPFGVAVTSDGQLTVPWTGDSQADGTYRLELMCE